MKTDQEIQSDVIDELRWVPVLNATEIGVAVHNGIVTLSGSVKFYSDKLAAENAAKRVKGVRAVAEDLQVQLALDGRLTDTQIAESVIKALEWNTSVPHEKIIIKVDDGRVTLEGEVDWLYEKEAATNAINYITGVRGIRNWLTVKPRVNTAIVKEHIRKALERSADFEADKITIDTLGSKVILKGSARSWNERKEVERAAASAPGVTEVDDQLAVVY
ncbi:BON domain-containing protein [Pedobacter sp. P351]|uniref:BON domain-containing protein n=1 Tax=Pedobacter superstes TaxID=3133441 RepID=UPI0030AC6C71